MPMLETVPKSDPGFLDDADDQRNEIDDESVKGADQCHLKTSAKDGRTDVAGFLYSVKSLRQAEQRPEDGEDQGPYADFLHPAGSLPGSDEKGDKEDGNDDHPSKAALYEKSRKRMSHGFVVLISTQS